MVGASTSIGIGPAARLPVGDQRLVEQPFGIAVQLLLEGVPAVFHVAVPVVGEPAELEKQVVDHHRKSNGVEVVAAHVVQVRFGVRVNGRLRLAAQVECYAVKRCMRPERRGEWRRRHCITVCA
jgi:hypothetical protein